MSENEINFWNIPDENIICGALQFLKSFSIKNSKSGRAYANRYFNANCTNCSENGCALPKDKEVESVVKKVEKEMNDLVN